MPTLTAFCGYMIDPNSIAPDERIVLGLEGGLSLVTEVQGSGLCIDASRTTAFADLARQAATTAAGIWQESVTRQRTRHEEAGNKAAARWARETGRPVDEFSWPPLSIQDVDPREFRADTCWVTSGGASGLELHVGNVVSLSFRYTWPRRYVQGLSTGRLHSVTSTRLPQLVA